MSNPAVTEAVIVSQSRDNPIQASMRLALFNEDGTPWAGGGEPGPPGDSFVPDPADAGGDNAFLVTNTGELIYVNATGARTSLGLGTASTKASDIDGTFAANSDSRVPTQKAVKTYVDAHGGGLPSNIVSTSNNYVASDNDFVRVNSNVAARTVTLPATGTVYIKKTDSSNNPVYVDTVDGTINGDSGHPALQLVTDEAAVLLKASSANVWEIVSMSPATTSLDSSQIVVAPEINGNDNVEDVLTDHEARILLGGGSPPDASTATKGITKLSVAPSDADNPLAVGDNDPRLIGTALNTQGGTDYTLVAGDAGKLVTVSNAATRTLTIPTNASVGFAVGTIINVARLGAGAVNIAAEAGVTINSPGGALGLRVQYSQATLVKTGTNVWLLAGDIT